MRKFFILGIALILGIGFVSCSADDEQSKSGSGTGGTGSTTKLTDITKLQVGAIVTYEGEEYLVSRNFFYTENSAQNIDSSMLSDAIMVSEISEGQMQVNKVYIDTYLAKEFRKDILQEKLSITKYLELFKTGQGIYTESNGKAVLKDNYLILSSQGNKIAHAVHSWESDVFAPVFLNPADSTVQGRTEAFMQLTADQIRNYDPHSTTVENYPADMATKIQTTVRYNYYSAAQGEENYGKINLNDIYFTMQSFDWLRNAEGEYTPSYKIQRNSDGKVDYGFMDPFSTLAFCNLSVYPEDDENASNPRILLTVKGDGKVNGKTEPGIHKRVTTLYLFNSKPVYIDSLTGETKTGRVIISSAAGDEGYSADYSDQINIMTRTSVNNGSTWTTQSSEDCEFVEAADNCDCLSVSSDTVRVSDGNETLTVPSFITIYSPYKTDESGNYPTYNKYARINLYPVYSTFKSTSRIVYKVTEKSINEFIGRWQDDFSSLQRE